MLWIGETFSFNFVGNSSELRPFSVRQTVLYELGVFRFPAVVEFGKDYRPQRPPGSRGFALGAQDFSTVCFAFFTFLMDTLNLVGE